MIDNLPDDIINLIVFLNNIKKNMEEIIDYIRMQNMLLLKYIAYKEGWNYIELCKVYLN